MTTLDLTGQRFGRLVAVEPTDERSFGGVIWLCECDCGKKYKAKGSYLKSGQTKSCGCLKKEKFLQNQQKPLPNGKAAKNALYSSYKLRARRKHIEFSISKNEFEILTKQNCCYCGRNPFQTFGGDRYNGNYIYNGIDRKDSNKGYTIENCVTCCGICNRAKDIMTPKEFGEWIKDVYNNLFKQQ